MANPLNSHRSRRSFFRNMAASLAGSVLLPRHVFARDAAGVSPRRKLRIAQITDTHVIDEKSATNTRRLISKIIKEEKPDMIFHTGDIIMDAMKAEKPAIVDQWKLWKTIIADVTVPIRYCIGNHDVWWHTKDTSDPLYGKNWVQQELGLPGRYYSFSKDGWHFIFLDSTQPHESSLYVGSIDEEQLQWLTGELKEIPSAHHVLIASHIPLLSASIFDWSNCKEAVWNVSGGLMHTDSHKVQALLRAQPAVKGCISGHLHLQDNIRYDGIDYMGCGAVSGNWWSDSVFHQTIAGYAVLDCFDDGSLKRMYKEFDWEKA